MKNLKSIALVAFATVFGFSSCSNSDDLVNQETEQRTVFFKLNKNASGSRAVGPHVSGNEVTFSNGYLYLVDAKGKIYESVKINPGDGEFDKGVDPKTIGIEKLTTVGVTLDNINAKVTKAYVVGNTILQSGENVNDIFPKAKIKVENIFDETNHGINSDAPLFGEGVLEPVMDASSPFNYKVQVQVKAVSSRLEIGSITAKGAIKDFKVEGIFINNYYTKLGVDGSIISDADVNDNKDVIDNYKEDGGSYSVALKEIIYDYDVSGLGALDKLVCWPDGTNKNRDNKVWGYNFLVATDATKAVSPQIVVRLKDVKVGEAEASTIPYFLTISTLKNGANDLAIEKGYAYRIQDIEFDEGDLHIKPFEKNKNVQVDVTLIEWKSKDIGYELD